MNRRLLETPADRKVLVRALTDGPTVRAPAGSQLAKRCRCKSQGYEPWLELDADGDRHCLRCGCDA